LDPLIRRFEASSGILPLLGGSLNNEEGFPNSGVHREPSQNSDRGDFRGFLAQDEESFFDPNLRLQELNGIIYYRYDLRLAASFATVYAMASRGRRGAPAREGEQRRELSLGVRIRVSSRPPAPQGPVLPPPPLVDYGVFMQGLERADVWWSFLLRTRFEDSAVDVAWDDFMRLFWAKFVPEHIQDKME
ncbi:hypothetical protein Taro_000072, partial [Colocasia esculenta]|nr:hypothetical protein [Colocasia esculenta]